MDKELLRIVIIVVGLVVIAGMLLWGFILDKKNRGNPGLLNKQSPLGRIDPSLVVHTEDDEFDIIPLGSATDHDLDEDAIDLTAAFAEPAPEQDNDHIDEVEQTSVADDIANEPVAESRRNHPELIQYSIVSLTEHGFDGKDLLDAFKSVGLSYGDMQIFERIDENKMVNFAVASMVEPGVFPDQGLAAFSTPGIVFFMQPGMVDNPQGVYDDLIAIMHRLSRLLNGVEWDNERQPLTEATINSMRDILSI